MVRCPRCGSEGRLEEYVVNGRRYLRVVHGSGKDRKQCYIGPSDNYFHAAALLRLGLTNLKDVDYAELAIALAWRVETVARTRGLSEPEEWLPRVKRLREELELLLPKLEKLEEMLEQLAKEKKEEEHFLKQPG